MFRQREDVAVGILEPRDFAGGALPDAELVLFDALELLEHDAATAQRRRELRDVLDLPPNYRRSDRHEFLHSLRDDLRRSAPEDGDVRILILEGEAEDALVESSRAFGVGDPDESIQRKRSQH